MDDSYAIATPHNDAYNLAFSEMNPHGAPRIGAADAANFLKKSNLPMPMLGQIWELSDSQKTGSLDKRGAFVAFKLVAAAQQGKPVANSSLYDSSLQPPRFGPPVPPASMQHHFQPSFPSPGRAPPVPPPPHPSYSHPISSQQSSPAHPPSEFPPNWPITPNDQVGIIFAKYFIWKEKSKRYFLVFSDCLHHSIYLKRRWLFQAKYDSIFQSLNPVNGKLSGTHVRPVLMNSGLDAHALARIWELSDQDKDGNLDRIEMSVALHLVYRSLQSDPIPAQLPPNLIHPSKAMFAQRSPNFAAPPHPPRPMMGSRAGSVTSLDDVNMSQSYSATMPRSQPPPVGRTFSSQPHVNGSRTSGASTPISTSHSIHSFSGGEWPIHTADYADHFAQTDTNRDGLVDGQDMRGPMMTTGLSPQILAHVWALADIKKCGQLNLEQFSLTMYLLDMAKRGEPLPAELPSHLVPPSFRPPTESTVTTHQPAQSVSTPQLPEATSMEIKEALEGENEEMRQLAEAIQSMVVERKTAEEAVVQLEADMTVKNSRIKNLQVELTTLESTVKQLERQKTEATRRLNDYDTQIEQLEAACKAQKEKKEDTEKRMQQIDEEAKNAEECKANDEKEMEELKREIEMLDNQFKTVRGEIVKETAQREQMVADLTTLERKEARDQIQMERLDAAIEKTTKLTEAVSAAVEKPEAEMAETLRSQPHLLSSVIDQTLLSDDTVYGETAGASSQNHVQQPPDPFASARSSKFQYTTSIKLNVCVSDPAADPFAQVDPFGSSGHFDAAFPTDPFAQGGFPPDAGFNSSAPAKPAPPRPAPPKSARETPVNDPFAPSQGQAAQPAGFADFADFGSAFN
ncbi:CRE-EHS-1 protein [Caenorhabditis remanei]|uniref:CRE-EHS-1 protein n=1 Tax=Caenorhabditis remanei TaxID=31234 RepID=E3M4W6_CAERE|nr:CRE-EHS-1 protein [Caenorhabditis remanei]